MFVRLSLTIKGYLLTYLRKTKAQTFAELNTCENDCVLLCVHVATALRCNDTVRASDALRSTWIVYNE